MVIIYLVISEKLKTSRVISFQKKRTKRKLKVKIETAMYTHLKWDSPCIIIMKEFLRTSADKGLEQEQKPHLSFAFT